MSPMHTLSIQDLHSLRLAIFENAEALHREAELLLQQGMHCRAYLLAHLCFEELGKILIVFEAVFQLERGKEVDWKAVKKAFTNHKAKIAAQNGNLYSFGSQVRGDIDWLLAANKAVSESYERKNLATYVDAKEGRILRPSESIGFADANRLVALAHECLRAQAHSEGLINPLLYEAEEQGRLPGLEPEVSK